VSQEPGRVAARPEPVPSERDIVIHIGEAGVVL
jgi:hypothetical protein